MQFTQFYVIFKKFKWTQHILQIDFDTMEAVVACSESRLTVRRLSTPPYLLERNVFTEPQLYLTHWRWFWKDDDYKDVLYDTVFKILFQSEQSTLNKSYNYTIVNYA